VLHVPGLTAPILVELQGDAVAAQVESGLMQSSELERTQVGGEVGATQVSKTGPQAAPHHINRYIPSVILTALALFFRDCIRKI
jgi:hypothetical protein